MTHKDVIPALYQLYHRRWQRADELNDVLLRAIERIADGKENLPVKAAELALDEYDAIGARHFDEDQQAERERYAEEAAEARREELMMRDRA